MATADQRLAIGLIGCGGMAKVLARAANRLPRARVVKVCDVSAEAAQAFAQELEVPHTADPGEILADPAIPAVIIATPNFTHADLVVRAAAAGKHVFCEKPMALTTADADRMVAATRAAGVHLVVGQVLRYLPVFHHIKRLIDEGKIGTPFAMRTSRLGGWGQAAPWRSRRETSGGPLFEVNAHELDYMRYILGEPETVYATGSRRVLDNVDYEDTALVTLTFHGGGHAVLHTSIGAALGGYSGVIQGTEGTLNWTCWPDSLEWKRLDGTGGKLAGKDDLPAPDAHEREVGHLVDAVLDGTPPAITGADGRAVVAMAEGAVRSMQTGQPVRLG